MGPLLTVPKMVLIFWPEIPQMPQNLFTQFVNEKRIHLASEVRALWHSNRATTIEQNYFN